MRPHAAIHGSALQANCIPIDVRLRSYITVSDVSDRQLFYLVADREHSDSDGPRNDLGKHPVLLWLTGGPGCSSLDAWTYEHGLFLFNRSSGGKITLSPNPSSWTKAATVIYVDSPAGAGMSYRWAQLAHDALLERHVHLS
jgi:serine carboxypeptidase-like clade 1